MGQYKDFAIFVTSILLSMGILVYIELSFQAYMTAKGL